MTGSRFYNYDVFWNIVTIRNEVGEIFITLLFLNYRSPRYDCWRELFGNLQLQKQMIYDGISIFEIRSFVRWPVIEICVYAFKSKNFHFLENYIVLHLTLKLEWWCKGNICVFDYLFSFFREFNFCYVFITSISLSVCMYVNCRSCKYTPNGWKMLQDCKLFYRIFPIEIRVYLTKNLCIGMDKRIRIQNI